MSINWSMLTLAAILASGSLASARAQTTTRVSVDSSGVEANDWNNASSISADGRLVAFQSGASNLVIGDTNGSSDIFVHDLDSKVTIRVSVDSFGAEGHGPGCGLLAISADGVSVAFESSFTNLVSGDTNGKQDIFVHDRSTGITKRVSVDSSGTQANDHSGSYGVAINADGRYVAFDSFASNLVAGDTNGMEDVFVHDSLTGLTERVSVDSAGGQGNSSSGGASISADGRFVAFYSFASNLVPGDTNGYADVFVHDRLTGTTERVSLNATGGQGFGWSVGGSISSDGDTVAFMSGADLVAGDTNGVWDVFVYQRSAMLLERVSVDSSGVEGNGDSYDPSLSADGRIVTFVSDATNLVVGDTNGLRDSFVRNRNFGTTDRVSVASTGAEGNGGSEYSSISQNGLFVTFYSEASNLVPNDVNGQPDIFVRDLCGTTAFWSNYGSGFPGTNGVPKLTALHDPVLGTTISVVMGSSANSWTIAALLVGTQEASVPLAKGGNMLVIPNLTVIIVALPPMGLTIDQNINGDPALCGLQILAQTLMVDPGATKGQSASAGLKLSFGH